MGVPQEGAGQEGLITSIQELSALFYANDGLIASTESACLQGAFNALTGIFDRVGIWTNEEKIVSMDCWPCHTPHVWSMDAYTRRVIGIGLLYRDWMRQRVHFLECGVGLTDGSLTAHR